VKVDGHIELFPAKPASKCEVVRKARQPAWTLDDDEGVDVWIVPHHRFGGAFHEIGDGGRRKLPANAGHGRRREDDIADQAKPDEQNLLRMTLRVSKGQGSTVASSISITGMSSLIGYTR
jgi:hypothetical protein